LASDGTAEVYHATSGRRLLSLRGASELRRIAWNPRGDVLLGLEADGRLAAWRLECPHPEVSWQTLFGRTQYEGYDEPAYVWQTTGGEEYEPKYSLVPLLFGTLKGTIYAMLLATPLGLFGAVYVSHFTQPAFRRAIKPCVEIMAALPSVVIGFLVALWLAPLVERYVIAVFASLVTVPLCLALFLALWRMVRHRQFARRVERGYEFLAVIPVLVLGILLAVWLVGPLENLLFDGNFKLWLHQTLHARYDQRNNIVIAFGLGLAVIPIIFSLADEALSNVPHSLSAASLALGASRWQTVWRVVLPSASPAIFAAMMIGFGRAVGETMIVLMATGNTPLLDWSPLNGMRTLSANIAVEIPEAPVGGTLYRLLFLCAVLLFLVTFTLNTLAEVVRQRLRRRYGRY
jgi:phosphate transport system permease protein